MSLAQRNGAHFRVLTEVPGHFMGSVSIKERNPVFFWIASSRKHCYIRVFFSLCLRFCSSLIISGGSVLKFDHHSGPIDTKPVISQLANGTQLMILKISGFSVHLAEKIHLITLPYSRREFSSGSAQSLPDVSKHHEETMNHRETGQTCTEPSILSLSIQVPLAH